MDPVSAAIYGAASAFAALVIKAVISNTSFRSKSFTVKDPGPSYYAVCSSGVWYMYRMHSGTDHVLKNCDHEEMYWEEDAHPDITLDYPNLYAFDVLDDAVDAVEEMDGVDLINDACKDRIISEGGRHVFFRREADRRSVEVHSDDVDLDELMEAQFGDEDLSDVKLGAERTYQALTNG